MELSGSHKRLQVHRHRLQRSAGQVFAQRTFHPWEWVFIFFRTEKKTQNMRDLWSYRLCCSSPPTDDNYHNNNNNSNNERTFSFSSWFAPGRSARSFGGASTFHCGFFFFHTTRWVYFLIGNPPRHQQQQQQRRTKEEHRPSGGYYNRRGRRAVQGLETETDKSKHVRDERNPLCAARPGLSYPRYVYIYIFFKKQNTSNPFFIPLWFICF